MKSYRTANWKARERQMLSELLRTAIDPTGHEADLLEELLRRWEDENQKALTQKDAARVMHIQEYGNWRDSVTQYASRLRRSIREASKTLDPDPQASLTYKKYAIRVKADPPSAWKQTIGPSIGLLLADASDNFVGDLIRGVTEVCGQRGYDLVVDESGDNPTVEMTKLGRLLERTRGVLVVPVSDRSLNPEVQKMLRKHDCVLVDRYLVDLDDVLCVHNDDVSAGRQAAIYLEKCSRVLIVDQASRRDNFAITALKDRVRGFRIEFEKHGVVCHLPIAGWDERGGVKALKQFDELHGLAPGDGIFALTDRLALGCRHYLAERQLNLPVIGCEGESFGEFMNPLLTSIEFDDIQTGRFAAQVLFAKHLKEPLPPSDCAPHYLIPTTLLKASESSTERDPIPIRFPDAASHYSKPKNG